MHMHLSRNIDKMKLQTGTFLTTNIQRVLESALVTEIARKIPSVINFGSRNEVYNSVTSLTRAQSHNVLVGLPVPTYER